MIDWVHDCCTIYGVNMRRHVLGGYFYDKPEGGKGFHFDGNAASSLMHKINLWGTGALDGPLVQSFPEWLSGDALAVWRAADGMVEHRRVLLNTHYLLPKSQVPTKQKVSSMKELFPDKYPNRQAYYDEIDRMHEYLAARLRIGGPFHGEQSVATV